MHAVVGLVASFTRIGSNKRTLKHVPGGERYELDTHAVCCRALTTGFRRFDSRVYQHCSVKQIFPHAEVREQGCRLRERDLVYDHSSYLGEGSQSKRHYSAGAKSFTQVSISGTLNTRELFLRPTLMPIVSRRTTDFNKRRVRETYERQSDEASYSGIPSWRGGGVEGLG